MAKLKRYDIKKLLANPDLRRHLIVESTIVTQAREGIDVTHEQAENSYYIVTEAERAAFFGLVQFRTEVGENDGRHLEFVHCLRERQCATRVDLALRDFGVIDSSPIAYDKLGLCSQIFRDNPSFDSQTTSIEQGVALMNVARYVRFFWEVDKSRIALGKADRSSEKPWLRLSKGGDFSRFYYDFDLVLFGQKNWEHMKEEINERYPYLKGNSSLLIHPENHYFESGVTWPRRTQRGFNVRFLPPGHVFSDKGPTAFFRQEIDLFAILGLLNSRLAEYLLKALVSFGSWEIIGVRRLASPDTRSPKMVPIAEESRRIYNVKQSWDAGNEVSTRFNRPWVLKRAVKVAADSPTASLGALLGREAALDAELAESYARLNDGIYRLYGVNDALRAKIDGAIGERPSEVVWPQMVGKSAEQKRMEHVCRLLTYAVKCVLDEDDDGLVALQPVAQEPPLLERVRAKLVSFFPEQDPHTLEIEVVNELKKRVKGYARAESLHAWLTHVFFDFHCGLYQQRPILWHLASSQESPEPAFSVIVHYHRFDHDRLAKLRSVHVRDRLATLRREAAQAGKDGREDDRLELLAAVEEVEAFDGKLARLQEGHHAGAEGGDEDYRILTPWKKPDDRPKGWRPDLDDGVKVNIAALARTGLLRNKNKFGQKEPEE